MSAIQGTYINDNIGATLVIAKATDANGEITEASMTYNGQTYGAKGHYHFKNSSGPTTVIVLNGLNDGVGYISLALTAEDPSFKTLRSFGGYVNFDAKASGLGGEFVKH